MRSRGTAIGIIILALMVQGILALGVQYERPRDFYSPDEGSPASPMLNDAHSRVLVPHSALFADTAIIDFEKRQISFERRDSLGYTVGSFHYDELGEYLADRRELAVVRTWYLNSQFAANSSASQAQNKELKLAWEMPVQYPGWAQRVLGNDPPRLTITGSLKIKMAYEDVQRKESIVTQSQTAAPGFNFEQVNQFNITGSVGRLINLNISANSEDGVSADDPLKKMKIDYQESKPGELEDEVVQQVSAGYMGFSMPGTQLSGYSESKEGLFGIKIMSKFGPLTLTTIASTEQGETQKLSVSNNGKASAGNTTAKGEEQFIQDRYFFLDTTYISWYNRKYGLKGGTGTPMPDPLTVTMDIQVWKEIDQSEAAPILLDPSRQAEHILVKSTDGTDSQNVYFVKLRLDQDYHLYSQEGYIKFYDSAQIKTDRRIGIYMRTKGGQISKGGDPVLYPDGKQAPSYLWELKSYQSSQESMTKNPDRFRLMWRNVYEIPGDTKDIAGFVLRIFSVPTGKIDTIKTVKDGRYLTEVMGLSKGTTPLTQNPEIFDFSNREIKIPPFDTSAHGNEPFANPDLGSGIQDTQIYRFGKTTNEMTDFKPVWTIEMSGTSKQKVFNLDIGVMENTVIVKADGVRLEKNIDYALNTEVGNLELTSARALAADKIDIEYQREALFVPERKVFLGARGEMQLPFISDKSFMGLSVLYQGTNISQPIPRINQEPFQKLLLDFNTKIDFQPDWMTKAVNAIPLVKTDAQSSVTSEFEVAHSRMNPNTENQAYVDDFESVKQTYQLGESYRNWYTASPPWDYAQFPDSLLHHPPAWDQYWFTPVNRDTANRISRLSMWLPNPGEQLTGTDLYETVLRLHIRPSPGGPAFDSLYRNTWAGIMTPVPVSMADRKRDQYFELMVKVGNRDAVPGRGRGKLRIQMGTMREDICISGAPPNGRTNREDTSLIWRDNRDPALDRGLDMLTDDKEYWVIPNPSALRWDTLKQNDPLLGEWRLDPSKDNYRLYDEEHSGNFKYACRLEKDGYATSTEDINMDGTVDVSTKEQYHEFVINLADTNSPYIDQTAKSKIVDHTWRRYRLPLHEVIDSTLRREVGGLESNDWHNIRMVRLIWDGIDPDSLDEESQLVLSTMQFVGNQWEALRDSLGRTKIDVSVIGTRESGKYDTSIQPLVTMTHPRIARAKDDRNIYQPEQSLRLNFHDIGPGQVQLAQRNFTYQKLDLASYDEMSLEVFGMDIRNPNLSGPLFNGQAQFIIRFGNDTTTYYQVRKKINAGWNNQIHINLKEISNLKLDMLTNHTKDSTIWSPDSAIFIRAPRGRQPSFSNIIWMAVGIVRDSGSSDPALLDNLELWVDELKVVGIKKFNGWSSRLNLTTQWADFLTLSGDLTYQGGDFRTMTDNAITMGDSKLSGNLSVTSGLDKFMPKEWGVAMPIGASMNTSLTRPQLMPNTDVYLTDKSGDPDGFIEMVKSVMSGPQKGDSGTKAEHFETRSFSDRFFINYSKASTSTNPAIDLLLQRLSSEFAYSMSANETKRGQRPNSSEDYANSDSNKTYTGGLRYNLTPKDPPPWTKWKPMDSIRAKWLPQRFKEIELTFLPKNASLNLANASFTSTMERRFESEDVNTTRYTKDFTLNHGLQLDFTPISPVMDLSYSLTVNREFPDSLMTNIGNAPFPFMNNHIFATNSDPTWKDYYILDRERSRAQRFKMTFNPQIVDWLTNSADYSANYDGSVTKWGNDNSKDYLNAKVNSGVTFNSSLTIATLLKTGDSAGSLAKMIRNAKKGCDYIGFNSVNFTYSMTSDLTNNYLGTAFLNERTPYKQSTGAADFMEYQLGLKDRNFYDMMTGDMNDRNAFGGMRYRLLNNDRYDFYKNDNRTVNWNCAVSTGLGITKPIDLQFSSISLRWSKKYTLLPDTTYYDTTISFPEFSVGARSSVLEKVALLTKYTQGLGLSSNFSYKQGTIKNSGSAGIAATKGYDLSPLVAVDGSVKKWPIRFNYQHTLGHEERKQGTDASATNRNGDNMEMTYEIPPPATVKTIKVLKWSFPIKGKTSMAMQFTRDWSQTVTRGSTTAENSNLSVKPNVAYDFTTNVTGRVEYTGSRTTEMGGAITTSNIFGIVAEIRF